VQITNYDNSRNSLQKHSYLKKYKQKNLITTASAAATTTATTSGATAFNRSVIAVAAPDALDNTR
jgi:hypothetical protein